MAWAFHQNLQNFGGGGDPAKVQLLINTLTKNRTSLKNPIIVAGFTEITNGHTSLTQLPQLFSALTLDRAIISPVGTTAIANKDEYISIGWSSRFISVLEVGIVQARSGTGFDYQAQDYTRQGTYTFTPGQITDSRGLLYIYGQNPTTKKKNVFGFMHNVYTTGDKTRFPMNLGKITQELYDMYDATVILGGDFNVWPVETRNGFGHSCAAVSIELDDDDVEYLDTTLSNPYDWWYVDDSSYAANKDARRGYAITDDTTGPLALFPSDHHPILLQIK